MGAFLVTVPGKALPSPGRRYPEGVRDDAGEGLSSAATARNVYGVVLDKDQTIVAGPTTALGTATIPGTGG